MARSRCLCCFFAFSAPRERVLVHIHNLAARAAAGDVKCVLSAPASSSVFICAHRKSPAPLRAVAEKYSYESVSNSVVSFKNNHVTDLFGALGWNRLWIRLRRNFSHRQHILCKQVRDTFQLTSTILYLNSSIKVAFYMVNKIFYMYFQLFFNI